ncbi:MFS general substrate transporter [Xylaria bambusicola]|uniref:MFS general substrate transporter n=1 Tax=Xylaria bambusicola TaxID=326684 RepID=UPI0020079CB7|nr:MFS general substrate transporter [Xylaria bambusicola]KAI0518346.1 MFS general substrate transporter [Xylaria bambusicola]
MAASTSQGPMISETNSTGKTPAPPPSPSHPQTLAVPGQNLEAEENYKPKTFKFWSVIISAFLCLFLISLDRTIIGTATPSITQDFQGVGDIGWYGSAYLLTTAATQFIFSKFYKSYDIKWTFLVSVFFFEAGSALCGAAPNSVLFILGRAIAGVGGAGIFSGVTIILFHMIPLRKQPIFQGIFGAVFGISSVIGPIVGGAFTTHVSWRKVIIQLWCFYINLPIGGVAVVCLVFFLHPKKIEKQTATLWEQFLRLDPLGSLFFIPSVVSLLIALEWGGSTWPWNSWRIIVLLVVFGVLFIAFVAVQVRWPDNATVPWRIISQRSILAASIFMFSISGAMFIAIFYLPLWFQVILAASAIESGVYTLPLVLSLVVSANISGILIKKTGYYVPAMIICPSLMAIGLGLITTFKVNESSSKWIGYQFITGFGLGFGIQASNLATRAVLPMPDVPTGLAIIFFFQQLGGAIFTSVGQSLLSTFLVEKLADIPNIDPAELTNQGAVEVISSLPPQYQAQVKEVYNFAINRIFKSAYGVSIVAVVAALCMEWKNVNTVKPSDTTGTSPRPVSPAETIVEEGKLPEVLPVTTKD